MFTKTSERLQLVLFVIMGKTNKNSEDRLTKNAKIRHWRAIEKSKRRQAYFISDYQRTKYFQQYTEAVHFYNALNILHPTKNDLRKTKEYINWQRAIKGKTTEERSRRRQRRYENIDEPHETEPESPESTDEPHETEPESPKSADEPHETEPESPESTDEPHETEPESPKSADEPHETELESPESADEPHETEPESPENMNVHHKRYEDRMRLEIPLFNHYSPITKPATPQHPTSIHTHTAETIIEETLDQAPLENSILNELSTERINQMIEELRQDPELHEVFAEVDRVVREEEEDEGIFFDTVGANLEIDVDIDDRLEMDLLNW